MGVGSGRSILCVSSPQRACIRGRFVCGAYVPCHLWCYLPRDWWRHALEKQDADDVGLAQELAKQKIPAEAGIFCFRYVATR